MRQTPQSGHAAHSAMRDLAGAVVDVRTAAVRIHDGDARCLARRRSVATSRDRS